MSSRTIGYLGYAVIAAVTAGWSFVAARRSDVVTLPGLLGRLARSRVLRLVLVAVWGWIGWHLFARGSGAFQ
jgi:hypothetical protein